MRNTLAARTSLAEVSILRCGNALAWHAIDADSNRAVLAVCGTNDSLDWLQDADADQIEYQDGHVHHGFFRHAEFLWPELIDLIDEERTYCITGHSLGGAVAQILATMLNRSLGLRFQSIATFGSPRVLSPRAAALCSSLPIRNYANVGDLVPSIPPRFWRQGYNHAGLRFYLHPNGQAYTERRLWLRRMAVTALGFITVGGSLLALSIGLSGIVTAISATVSAGIGLIGFISGLGVVGIAIAGIAALSAALLGVGTAAFVMSGAWKDAWDYIKTTFDSMFGHLMDIFKLIIELMAMGEAKKAWQAAWLTVQLTAWKALHEIVAGVTKIHKLIYDVNVKIFNSLIKFAELAMKNIIKIVWLGIVTIVAS